LALKRSSPALPDPRLRLQRLGVDSLTDAELLAICLGTGGAGQPVDVFAFELLEQFGGVAGLLSAPASRLLAVPGIGPARAALLIAIRGLLDRFHQQELIDGPVLSSSDAVRGFLRSRLAAERREVFACLFLDSRHRLISFEALFLGTVDRASVHPREVLRRCLELNAAALILAHNHPSGIAEPSSADISLTGSLGDLLRQIDVRLLDHLVVARAGEVSLAERGLL
jgi:DNA repair protein RadC